MYSFRAGLKAQWYFRNHLVQLSQKYRCYICKLMSALCMKWTTNSTFKYSLTPFLFFKPEERNILVWFKGYDISGMRNRADCRCDEYLVFCCCFANSKSKPQFFGSKDRPDWSRFSFDMRIDEVEKSNYSETLTGLRPRSRSTVDNRRNAETRTEIQGEPELPGSDRRGSGESHWLLNQTSQDQEAIEQYRIRSVSLHCCQKKKNY